MQTHKQLASNKINHKARISQVTESVKTV